MSGLATGGEGLKFCALCGAAVDCSHCGNCAACGIKMGCAVCTSTCRCGKPVACKKCRACIYHCAGTAEAHTQSDMPPEGTPVRDSPYPKDSITAWRLAVFGTGR